MARDARVEHGRAPPKRIPAVSAVFSAVFTYFAFTLLTVPILDTVFQMEIFHYRNFPLLLAIVVVAGMGLWWVARRYNTSSVQTGALIGTGIMIVVGFVQVRGFWGAGIVVPLIVTIPVGLGILVVVNRLAANPSKAPGERIGAIVLWRSLLGVVRRPRSYQLPSVSRYWLIVGGAFVICIPIAVVETELGLGLLSAFLTAYGLSHQIDRESNGPEEGE